MSSVDPSLVERRLYELIRRRPGMTTEELTAALAPGAGADLAPWLLADNFREADGRWYLRGRPLHEQASAGGRETAAVAALECFLSEGPRATEEVCTWYARTIVDPPAVPVDELLERHFVKTKTGWRLPTRKERRRFDQPSKSNRRRALHAFRQAAVAVLARRRRPTTAGEVLTEVFAAGAPEWVHESEPPVPGCPTAGAFVALCGPPGAASPEECAAALLAGTPGVRRYDARTFGLVDWPDECHLVYYWNRLEASLATGRERDFLRCAATVTRLQLPDPLAQRVHATLPIYRQYLVRRPAPRRPASSTR